MLREKRLLARELRRQGKALNEIVEIVGAAKSSVSLWVRDIELTNAQVEQLRFQQRQFGDRNMGSQTNRATALELRKQWQQEGRERARLKDSELHFMGCMLYWAEGDKERNKLHLINSDSDILCLFLKFLRVSMSVPLEKISIFVHSHEQSSERICQIEEYWLNLLSLPKSALRMIHTRVEAKERRRHTVLTNGLCAICVHDTALVQHVFGAIQEYTGVDMPELLG